MLASGLPAMFVQRSYERQVQAASEIDDMKRRMMEKEVATAQNRVEFITRIDMMAGLTDGRQPERMRLLPDAATQMAEGSNQNRAGEERLIEAVKHMYFKGTVTGSDERVIGFERSYVKTYVDRIRKEYVHAKTRQHTPLVDTPYSLQLTRAIHNVCGIFRKGVYTDFEYHEAVARAVIDPGAKYTKIRKDLGVPEATIRKGVQQVQERVGQEQPTEALKQKFLANMTKNDVMQLMASIEMSRGEHVKRGPKPLLTVAESAFMCIHTGMMADCGLGKPKHVLCSQVRRSMNEEGTRLYEQIEALKAAQGTIDPRDETRAKRLMEAKFVPKTWDALKKRANASGLLGELEINMRGKKARGLSQRRATTNLPFLTQSLFEQYEKAIQDMIDDKALVNETNKPWTQLLEAEQIINGDEIQVKCDGTWERVECFKGRRQIQKIMSGEGAKTNFQTTLMVTTKADGTLMKPFIVHQGEKWPTKDGEKGKVNVGNTMVGDPKSVEGKDVQSYLPRSWGYGQTPSGYMSPEDVDMYADHLIDQLPFNLGPYLFMWDGAGPHWNMIATGKLRKHRIYVLFLRSNNSENDQANDNGPNAVVSSTYKQTLSEWKGQYDYRCLLTFRPYHLNEVLVTAWSKLENTCGGVIRRAYARTGMFPISLQVALSKQGAHSTGTFFHTTASTTPEHFEQNVLGQVCTTVITSSPDKEGKDEAVEVQMSPSELETQKKGVFIRQMAVKCLQGQAYQSAETVRQLKMGKELAKTKLDAIDGVQMNRIGNADTTGGLYLSRHVERTVKRNHEEQELKKRKQDEKSQLAQEKKRARHAELQSTADTVRQVLLSGTADWQKHLKAQDIKVAANLILHPRSFTSQKEAAPALQEWADAQRAALASRIPALGACSLVPATR